MSFAPGTAIFSGPWVRLSSTGVSVSRVLVETAQRDFLKGPQAGSETRRVPISAPIDSKGARGRQRLQEFSAKGTGNTMAGEHFPYHTDLLHGLGPEQALPSGSRSAAARCLRPLVEVV
jgi:hypothetical protein